MNERRDFPGLHTPGPHPFPLSPYQQQQHHHLQSPNLNAAAAANNNAIPNAGPFYISQGGIGAPTAIRYIPNPPSLAISNANPNNSPPEGPAVSPGPHHPLPPRMGMNMGFRSEPMKRKRGRPRKYSDGAGLGLSSATSSSNSLSEKRARGSGSGSGSGSNKKIQMAALGSAGHGFTPHIITVAKGEDVSQKITAFLQQGPWAVCVLSANGSISNVTLQRPMPSESVTTYEGRFEILSLSGSFVLTEGGGSQKRTGGLTVSLAGADGNVVGGGVAGEVIAASPVQVVVGTFLSDAKKGMGRTENSEPSGGTLPASISGRPPSPVALHSRNEAFGGLRTDGGYCEQTTGGGGYTLNPEMLNNMNMQSMDWGSQFDAEARSNADATMTGGQRSIDLGNSYWSKDKEDEDH